MWSLYKFANLTLCVCNMIYILIVELKATLKKSNNFNLQKYSSHY